MKKFMAVYTGNRASPQAARWDALDENTRSERVQAGMEAWQGWQRDHAAIIAEEGGPLGKTKRVSSAGVADISNNLGGYVVIEAETHEAAARHFRNHPHFTIFPGDAVEIMPCNPMPTM